MESINTKILKTALIALMILLVFSDCKKEDDTTPPAPLKITLKATDASSYGSDDGKIESSVSGGTSPYTFLWSNGATTENLEKIGAGWYSLTVTDAVNQVIADSSQVSQPDPTALIINLQVTDVSAYNGTDGAITPSVNGGEPPYSFLWSTGATSQNLTGLEAGTYSVTVQDESGNTETDTATVSQPEPEMLSLQLEISHVSVYNGSDGSINLTVTGGVPPYIFNWSDGSTSEDLSDLSKGTYSVTVTDQLDSACYDTAEVLQPTPDTMLLSATVTNESTAGAGDGAIDLTVSGGIAPYTFKWSNSASTEDISSLTAGSYKVTVTDFNDIYASDSFTLICEDDGTVVDIDGNVYATVTIGNQTWFAENLKVTKSPDGNSITSYCYNELVANCENCGRLYTWNVAMNGSTTEKAQGLCPDGWHIPTDGEWKELEMALGMSQAQADMSNTWRGNDEGTKIISGGTSGMNILLCGRRSSSGSYSLFNSYEYTWTSTESGSSYAWRRCFRVDPQIGRYDTFPKSYAFSIRCIKD
jgi:uncharacterized protein (TIGR02145 family)